MSARHMKGLSLLQPADAGHLEKETLRIYEVCDGCRRCFNLCPSFNTLLDRIDVYESDVTKLMPADHHRVVDECYYCKLCFNHCPYTPPHQYAIDFPHLMIVWKKHLAAQRGVSWRDRLLIQTDFLGRLNSALAPVVNWTLAQPWIRGLLEQVLGIHRDRHVLHYQKETLNRWWSRRPRTLNPSGPRKVALFASCLVNYQATDVGKATVQVLEKNGVEVAFPDQQCCGMPSFDIGDTDAIVKAAHANIRSLKSWVERGYDIVVPVPSCSLMLKREYPTLVDSEDATTVGTRTFDICEYLMRLKREGALVLDFPRKPGRVAYQVPCHLRDQNIGFKSKELMECAGAQVEVIEKCSGHDGTWSAKTEFYPLSMKIAQKAVRAIEQTPADLVASDCPLSGLQLDAAGAAAHAGGRRALHPIQIVRDAYGLPSEARDA
ncbi:MAG TPA: heterodisulfide reductase-related iron-sulfur binding cluster [Nitrospiraceae bacterium]|nr:heterodisulfide reductase-related iron-sulfur binding cluster [Nitrospiraceae bacterium]